MFMAALMKSVTDEGDSAGVKPRDITNEVNYNACTGTHETEISDAKGSEQEGNAREIDIRALRLRMLVELTADLRLGKCNAINVSDARRCLIAMKNGAMISLLRKPKIGVEKCASLTVLVCCRQVDCCARWQRFGMASLPNGAQRSIRSWRLCGPSSLVLRA